MHWRMLCRQQNQVSTQSEAESKRAVKPRASRLAGSARGRASRIGERQSNDTCYLFGRTKQKTERGQNHRPKQDKKRRNDTGSAVNNGGGKPPPYTSGAGNSPRKERKQFMRTALPVCGRELPASSSRTAKRFRRSWRTHTR